MTQSYKKDQLFSCNLTQRPRIIKMTLKFSLRREEEMSSDEEYIYRKLGENDRLTKKTTRYDFLKLIGYKQVFPPLQQLITHKI